MINQLRANILSELQTIESVAEIYDGIPKKFSGFPAIFFNFDRVESGNLDSNNHERKYIFQINIFQEITNLGSFEAEKNICDLLDSVMNCLDTSDFGGLAIRQEAVGGDMQSVQTESGPAYMVTVVLGIYVPFSLH